MKKSYLMIAAAAALFAACSSNDVFREVENQDVVIGFSQSATEKNTRAQVDMDWFHTLNNAFGVFGFKSDAPIFTNEEVKCSLATSPWAWSHNTVRFWDKSASDAYDFYAYAPYQAPTGAGTEQSPYVYNPAFNSTKGFIFSGLPIIANIDNTVATNANTPASTVSPDKVVAAAVEDIDYADSRLHKATYTTGSGENEVTHTVHSNSPTVPFVFSHILSKLSFKIVTSIKPIDYETVADRVATFTVTAIDIDFPTATSVQWAENAKAAVAGATTYSNYVAKDGTFETQVFSGSQVVTNTATAIGNTYIVTPVNSSDNVTKHEFDVKVTYNVEYADGTTETGCKATGTIGTGTSPNIYAPAQNQYYIATININPAQIDFCVEGVNEWDPITEPAPVDVK